MSFFNKKEDVMDIQLTSYGKELLSRGEFKPVFYAFFDEGVLYDGDKAGITGEIQNNIQNRITKNTPYPKSPSDYLSPEVIDKTERGLVPTAINETELPLYQPSISPENLLGTSKNNATYAPAWQISTLKSEISTSTTFFTASATSTGSRKVQVPQININSQDITYNVSISQTEDDISDSLQCEIGDIVLGNTFLDGTELKIEDNFILLDISELNTLDSKDNFEIEVFEIKEKAETPSSDKKEEVLRPLKFFKFKPQIENGILVRESLAFEDLKNLEKIDDSFVSSFLDISIDGNVDQQVVCQTKPKNNKLINRFLRETIECDTEPVSRSGVYDPLDEGAINRFKNSIDEGCD
tara:strand:- start:513 stop:1571 length:1059 start_codon:yes stop_codon:yes gene_type:complete